MDVEENKGAETKPDVFGTERTADGKPVEAPAPAEKPEDKDGKGGDGKEAKPEDLENNPVVKALRDEVTKLNKDKDSMGGNLSETRKIIDKLEKQIKDITDGKKGASTEVPFKDIKRVKDLPKEEQEAMSESEKKLMDQLADTQELMNKQVSEAAKTAADAKAAEDAEAEEAVATEEFNSTVQTNALALVGVAEGGTPTQAQKDLANAIITEFNDFGGNEKLTAKQIKERLEKAAKLVPDYKAPKEQNGGGAGGKAPKPVDASGGSDIDKIVADVAKGTKGGTFSL